MKGLTTDEYEILEACTLPDSDAAKTIIAQMCGIGDPKAAGRLA